MSFVYLLLVYRFNYGFVFDHVEAFKSEKACHYGADHLPKGIYPEFDIFDHKTLIICKKTKVQEKSNGN